MINNCFKYESGDYFTTITILTITTTKYRLNIFCIKRLTQKDYVNDSNDFLQSY